jgi:hypothetical protein
MTDEHEVPLSPAFRAELERLPKESEPSRGFESRLLSALRVRGLVVPDAPRLARHPTWMPALRLAASLAIFAAGVALGHRLGRGAGPASEVARADLGAAQLAALVQRTGSAHVAALGDLAASAAGARPEETALAREVAMSSLRAALWQMVLLDPDDPTPARMLRELERTPTGTPRSIGVTAQPLGVSF